MKNQIHLPQLSLKFSTPWPDKELLLCGGGRSPNEKWLQQVADKRTLWCIDHGIDCCCRADLLPARLIGDGDSADNASWQWAAANNVPIAKFQPEKDFTDTQLALDMAAQEQAGIILTGAFGGRLDHLYSTAFTLANSPMNAIMSDEQETLLFISGGEAVEMHFAYTPKALSLLSFSNECIGVNISHVKWPLSNVTLKQSFPYSVSNEVQENPVTASMEQGILGIYICWQEKKEG